MACSLLDIKSCLAYFMGAHLEFFLFRAGVFGLRSSYLGYNTVTIDDIAKDLFMVI